MSGIDVAAVRPAADEELAGLSVIEQASEKLFTDAGLLLPEGTISVDQLREFDVVLVALGPTNDGPTDEGAPIGFAAVNAVDGDAYLNQLCVHPDYGRRGVGRGLLAAVVGWARRGGLAAVTLTTFRDVPWNAPFYARYGFVELADADLTPMLRAERDEEFAAGLDDIAPRVAMRKPLR